MDDKTRGLGDDDISGWSAETTRNLDTANATPGTRSTARTPVAAASRPATRRSAAAPTDPLDLETDIRTRELQAEIADTREDMAETIEAIQDRLRPGNIMSNATEQVKAAATEKVRHVAGAAGETAQELMHQTRRGAADVVEGARQNPIPALMIGAGVAWLLMDRSKSREGRYDGDSQYRRWSATGVSGRSGYGQAGYRTNHVAAGTGVDLTEPQYSDVEVDYTDTNRVRDYNTNRTWGSGNLGYEARESLSRTTRSAQNGLQRLLRDNPLLVGAAAVLVGAAVGAALPETERENEIMGETRDQVLTQAQDMARDAATTVQEVASDAVQKVTDRATESR